MGRQGCLWRSEVPEQRAMREAITNITARLSRNYKISSRRPPLTSPPRWRGREERGRMDA